ncbi:MAG: preprotein translocase subunit SecY [Clostridia bacterium]|nr:preprotein translocase subunit SecY [Clostridia bacterium]
MIETVRNAWKIKELRAKILFTIVALVVFRFGHSIYVPYVDTDLLATTFAAYSSTILGYFNVLAGGGLATASVFALSVYPSINASIIMQLLQVAIPALERLAKDGGEEGRKKLAQITRYVTVAIATVMGFSYYVMLKSQGVLLRTGAWSGIVIVLTFVAGASFVTWLGEQITEKGVGNGISMLIFIGIVSRGPSAAMSMVSGVINGTMAWWKALLTIILFVAIIAFVAFITNAERRIPVSYAKRVVGRKQYGGQSTHLPMKVNMAGVMPVIFASTIVTVPSTIAAFFTPAEGSFWAGFVNVFSQGKPLYIIVYVMLIFGFAYFYSAIQFNPIEVANNLKNNGGFIPGFRPGRPTSDFIAKVLNKITLMGAIFLAIVCGLPQIMSNIDGMAGLSVGGTSVIILVGVALDTVKAIENQMLMRHYKGFLE